MADEAKVEGLPSPVEQKKIDEERAAVRDEFEKAVGKVK